jgi:hypothetical protein
MSNRNGYCLSFRGAWTHDAFTDLLEASIWNYLFQNAFYEDGERSFNGLMFNLKRGQIVTTPRFIAKGFRISESSARRVIQKLIKLQMIATQTTTKATIISICNYDKFQLPAKTDEQPNEKQTKNRRNTDGANNNKENKIINKLNTPPTPEGEFNFIKWNGIRIRVGGSIQIKPEEWTYLREHKEEGEKAHLAWKKEIGSKRI